MIEFFSGNWLWILLVVGFIAMHRAGMGCGMGHGGHESKHRHERTTADRPVEEDARRSLR